MLLLCSNKIFKWMFKVIFLIWIYGHFIDCAAQVKRRSLSESILHYDTLNYPKQYVSHSHSRVRRSLDPAELLHLNFRAHSRNFDLRLHRDSSIFSDGLSFEENSFQPSNLYEGFLHGDPKSRVHGFIFDDIFEGRIHCGDGSEFHIESVKQYKKLNHTSDVHSVIYNTKDIVPPKEHLCGGIKAPNTKPTPTSHADQSEINDNHIKYDTPNIGYGPQPEVHHRQRRATFDPSKSECRLLVRGDHTYAAWAGSNERAIYLMTQYVKSVSHIYETTHFAGGNVPEQISLKIKRISIIPKTTTCTTGSADCQFAPDNIGVEKFLDISSLDNHNDFCLAYVFAHRDFSMGVLGLAWIGDPTGAGGICDRYQNIQGTRKSLNTGIVTNLNYGNVMSSKVTEITFAHEVGHNFGSQHDPSGVCSPGSSSGGNFIMYAKATSGADPNNFKFSTCSKNYIWPVLQARSASCFAKRGDPICGNRIKEPGEDCDCGYKGEQSCEDDKCCEPSDTSANTNPGCKFSQKANDAGSLKCSPSLGFCCDAARCLPFATSTQHQCSAGSECAEPSYCLENSHLCPNATTKPDIQTLCNNGSNVCKGGACTGSLCERSGQQVCQCTKEADYCKVCCQDGNQTATCLPATIQGNTKFLHSGSPCNQYSGYCDFLNKCRQVDAEGPLSRLKNLLFSSESIDNILDWMKTYWWACVLIGLGLVLFMAAFIACCSVHTPSSNPNKPPPRHLSLPRTISRRNRGANAPSAPQDHGGHSGYHRGPENPPGYDTAIRDGHGGYEMR